MHVCVCVCGGNQEGKGGGTRGREEGGNSPVGRWLGLCFHC